MSEQYPYPNAEHYVFPRNRAQVIADELSYYREPEDIREAVVALAEYYSPAPIMDAMKRFAFLNSAARIDIGGTEERPQIDDDFWLGALMGVHTSVHTLSSYDNDGNGFAASKRELILGNNSLRTLSGDEEDAETVQFLIGSLKVWDAELFEKRFNQAPEELQEAIFDLTDHMYCGIYNAQAKGQNFMSGYVFAINYIDRNALTPGPA